MCVYCSFFDFSVAVKKYIPGGGDAAAADFLIFEAAVLRPVIEKNTSEFSSM